MVSTVSDRAKKREQYQHLVLCLMPQLPLCFMLIGIWGGGYWLLLPTVFLMLLIPALDVITGWQDNGHYEPSDFTRWGLFVLHWNTRLYATFYMSFLVYVMAHIRQFNGLEIGLLIIGLGLVAGVGFGAAHELLHGKTRMDQISQRILTSFLFYPHYKLIHIRSHHHHAGTDHDHNTAWMNETIYSYIWRTIPGSMLRCWQLESNRYAKESFCNRMMKNSMITHAFCQVFLILGLFLLGGGLGLLFYALHLIVAHSVLESANYIQHYGLMRKNCDGKYEKTGPEHSWDTYHFFSSYVTFRVGHHSYHHIAVQPYYLLEAEPEAPKLPVGYFWAIPMVFIPGIWRRLVHVRLLASSGCVTEKTDEQDSGSQVLAR